jgi:hypothetical protein
MTLRSRPSLKSLSLKSLKSLSLKSLSGLDLRVIPNPRLSPYFAHSHATKGTTYLGTRTYVGTLFLIFYGGFAHGFRSLPPGSEADAVEKTTRS